MPHRRSPLPPSPSRHDFRNGGEIVRGNTVALAGMAAIEAIVPPLDDSKLAPSCDEQISATTFLDNADGHILCSPPGVIASTVHSLTANFAFSLGGGGGKQNTLPGSIRSAPPPWRGARTVVGWSI